MSFFITSIETSFSSIPARYPKLRLNRSSSKVKMRVDSIMMVSSYTHHTLGMIANIYVVDANDSELASST